jgi:hypothetical protein
LCAPCRAGVRSRWPNDERWRVSNLVNEILLRLVKPLFAALLGLVIFAVAVALGEPLSIALAMLSWLSAAAFILLVQEGIV